MKALKISMLAAAVSLAAWPALAQSTTTSPPPAPAATTTVDKTESADHFRASTLIGASVLNGANEAIGDINDLIISKDAKVDRVVVGVGGFLGIGEKNVVLPFNELTFTRDNNRAAVVMSKVTKETLQAMPEWKPADAHTMAR